MKSLVSELQSNPMVDFGSTSLSSVVEDKYKEILNYLEIYEEVQFFNCVIKEIVKPGREVVDYFGSNFIGLIPNTPYFWEKNKITDDSYKDNFNVVWKKVGQYYEKFLYPLRQEDVNSFTGVSYKEELNNKILLELEREAKKIKKEDNKYIVFSYPSMCGLLSTAINLRGMEEIFIDMYVNQKFYHKLLNNLLEIFNNFYIKCLKTIGKYIDVIVFKDDLGTQSNEMISTDMYNKFIGPYHQKLFENIKKYTKALIFYHSCGSIKNLIPELISCGIDILNPIQTSANNMDLFNLEKEFGKDIILWGGVDEQKVLSSHNALLVEKEVEEILRYFYGKGNYVFCASHVLQTDVPIENIFTMYKKAKNILN